jgi:hypothetical protein
MHSGTKSHNRAKILILSVSEYVLPHALKEGEER